MRQVTLGDSALRLSERANVLSQRAVMLERLAPNEHAPERYRRWLDALTTVHTAVLNDFLALSAGHGRPD